MTSLRFLLENTSAINQSPETMGYDLDNGVQRYL